MISLDLRIQLIRKKLGMTQSEFGEALGTDQGQVSRYERGLTKPKPTVLSEIARLGETTVEELVGNQSLKMLKSEVVKMVGFVEAGVFFEENSSYEHSFMNFPTTGRYPAVPKLGYQVKGDSMDKAYPEGTTLVCISIHDYGQMPLDGQRWVVTRTQGDRVKNTVKTLKRLDGEWWAFPESTNIKHQPFKLVASEETITEAKALVIASIRPE